MVKNESKEITAIITITIAADLHDHCKEDFLRVQATDDGGLN